MRPEEEGRVLGVLRQPEKLFRQLTCYPEVRSGERKHPQAEQRGKELGGFAYLLTELQRPGIRVFGLRSGKALSGHQRHAQVELQHEFSPGTRPSLWQGLE